MFYLTWLKSQWKGFLDWLLGPRCPECRIRVFISDREFHYRIDGCNGVWND